MRLLPAPLLLSITALLYSLPTSFGATAGTSNKRGLVYVPSTKHPSDDNIWTRPGSDLTWYYTYGLTPIASLAHLDFVPMQWGLPPASDTSLSDALALLQNNGAHNITLLTFNEPDGDTSIGGSSIPASAAAAYWRGTLEPLKQRYKLRLGAPAVTGAPSGFTWLQDFFKACAGACHPDFLPLHWYGNFEGLASHMGQLREAFPNLTLWVTEYALPNAGLADTQNFFNESAEYFDRLDYVERYSYFGSFRADVSNVGSNVAMLDKKGHLTKIGSWYLGGVSAGTTASTASGVGYPSAWAALGLLWALIMWY